MIMRDFNKWLENFRNSIASYDYYIDFEKVHRNVDNIKIELNILNSLVGSKNIEEDFEKMLEDKFIEAFNKINVKNSTRRL